MVGGGGGGGRGREVIVGGGGVRERGGSEMCSSMGTHHLWACIFCGHISSVSAYQSWVGGHCHLWAHIIHGHVWFVGGEVMSSVGTHHSWWWVIVVHGWGAVICVGWSSVGGEGVVVPGCCRLHGQAPVHECQVPFVGTGHCSWALGPLQVVSCGPWGSFMCG